MLEWIIEHALKFYLTKRDFFFMFGARFKRLLISLQCVTTDRTFNDKKKIFVTTVFKNLKIVFIKGNWTRDSVSHFGIRVKKIVLELLV